MPAASFVFAALMAATKTTTPSAGSTAFSYLILIVAVVGVFFFMRSRSTAARRQRDTLMELSAGDEVLTAAGIFGTVLDVEPDRVTLETAPGTRITVVRSTIARRIVEPEVNSVAQQNWQDEGRDGVAEAAGWHDPSEHDSTDDHPAAGDDEANEHKPEADGAPGAGQGGGR